MRVRDWQDLLTDVTESDADPDDWRAVAGDRASGVGEDLYLAHPARGVYLLKTYAKNPFEVRGVGSRVARKVDEDIATHLPDGADQSRFAVQRPPADESDAEAKAKALEETIKAHSDAPTSPDDLFEDVMTALDSPAYGPMAYDQYDRPDSLDGLASTFEDAESLLDAELEDLVDEDGVDRGFM